MPVTDNPDDSILLGADSIKSGCSPTAELLEHASLWFEQKRAETFTEWPFNEPAKCTPENMARAGFIYVPSDESPDSVRCFFCCKELDGWEPEDDPWEEHTSHSRGKCKFLSVAATFDSLTIKEFLQLEIIRLQNHQKYKCGILKQRFKDQAAAVGQKMEKLV